MHGVKNFGLFRYEASTCSGENSKKDILIENHIISSHVEEGDKKYLKLSRKSIGKIPLRRRLLVLGKCL